MPPPPPIEPGPRSARPVFLVCLAVAVTGCVAALYFFDPARGGFYPRCIFHVATGLDCPGCGGLRAAHQLLHGNVRGAFMLNPLLVSLLPVAAVFGVSWIVRKLRRQHGRSLLQSPHVAWGIAAVVIAFGLFRNLPWRNWFSVVS